MENRIVSLALFITILLMNLSVWILLNQPHTLPGYSGFVEGATYTPNKYQDPKLGIDTEQAEIEADMKALEGMIGVIRTYSSTEGQEKIPSIASKHHMKVTAGAWIDHDFERNVREINSLIEIAKINPNIIYTLVGNEALLRNDVTVNQLIGYIQEVRRKSGHPVSTAEPWGVGMKYPQLVKEVDFIGMHILPYWEGIAVEDSVDYVLFRYLELKARYPNKEIVITEVGWSSNGKPIHNAIASPFNQAEFIRDFLNKAKEKKIKYYIVEAFDQPWKMTLEGTGGA